MTRKKNPAVDNALVLVGRFLDLLVTTGKRLGWYEDDIFMTARDGSVLTLTVAERSQFYGCLVALGRAAISRPVAEESLRRSLEDALFYCLQEPVEGAASRVSGAVEIVRDALLSPARGWRVAFRIQWLEETELPFTYRNVTFVPATRGAVLAALDSSLPEREAEDAVFEFLPETSEGLAAAFVDVDACDLRSARAIGLELVHSAADELTGFTTLISSPSSHVLTEVLNTVPIALVTLASDRSTDDLVVDVPIPLPLEGVKPRTLFELLERASASPDRVRAIGGSGADGMIERIRSAARYIGRAQQCNFQHRAADAFLYYIVALESLLGKQDFRDSISYQLRMRVAHLLGRDTTERGEIEQDISRLYDVRSKLAHRGVREVHAAHLTQARSYAVRSLAIVLLSDRCKDFGKFSDFEEYFRQRLLS